MSEERTTSVMDSTGILTSASILEALNMIHTTDHTEPFHFYVSPKMRDRFLHLARIGRLYRAHPLPKRRIRKCYLRKIYANHKQGRKRIARIERKEDRRGGASLLAGPLDTLKDAVVIPEMPEV